MRILIFISFHFILSVYIELKNKNHFRRNQENINDGNPSQWSDGEDEKLKDSILTNWKEMENYVPTLGPFVEFQTVDMKKLAHMMISHRVIMKEMDVANTALRWRPIKPSMNHMYKVNTTNPE